MTTYFRVSNTLLTNLLVTGLLLTMLLTALYIYIHLSIVRELGPAVNIPTHLPWGAGFPGLPLQSETPDPLKTGNGSARKHIMEVRKV